MRKTNRWTPIILTVIFTAVIFGIFIYQQHGGSRAVSLSQIQNTTGHPLSFVEGKINVNNATAEELTTLPGIGEKLSQRIIAYRNEHGPFLHESDLKNVSGIGDAKLDAIIDYITLGG